MEKFIMKILMIIVVAILSSLLIDSFNSYKVTTYVLICTGYINCIICNYEVFFKEGK